MTITKQTVAGARAGLVAPDDTTFSYLEGRPHAPADWDAALDYWRTLPTDDGAAFDAYVDIDSDDLAPYVSWGTNPAQTLPVTSAMVANIRPAVTAACAA